MIYKYKFIFGKEPKIKNVLSQYIKVGSNTWGFEFHITKQRRYVISIDAIINHTTIFNIYNSIHFIFEDGVSIVLPNNNKKTINQFHSHYRIKGKVALRQFQTTKIKHIGILQTAN